jgi:hypothetical protein
MAGLKQTNQRETKLTQHSSMKRAANSEWLEPLEAKPRENIQWTPDKAGQEVSSEIE